VAAISEGLPDRCSAAPLSIGHPHAGRHAADPEGFNQASPVPCAKLNRCFARLSACCDFCYKEAFFPGGLFLLHAECGGGSGGNRAVARKAPLFSRRSSLRQPRIRGCAFDGMRGMGRLWQAAGTVKSVLAPGLMEKAAACGLRSLFVGFETLNPASLRVQHKMQNVDCDYDRAVRRLHDLGIMVNGSFVFGMDDDDESVFGRTVEWALKQGIETSTFHILTPYPGTRLHARMVQQSRILHSNWDLYDTRHSVFRPARLSRSNWKQAIGGLTPVFIVGIHLARRQLPRKAGPPPPAPGICGRLEKIRTVMGYHHPTETGVPDAAMA